GGKRGSPADGKPRHG
ncbi:phage terminase large subunit, partial [Escherichia coli PA4]